MIVGIWTCGHTKKCGWKGVESELVYTPDPPDPKRANCLLRKCPQCGGRTFDIKKGELPDRVEVDKIKPCPICELPPTYKGTLNIGCRPCEIYASTATWQKLLRNPLPMDIQKRNAETIARHQEG